MATRLQTVASTQALKNYAVGYMSDAANAQALLDATFLTGAGIPVASEFQYQVFNKGDAITIPNSLTNINDPVGAIVTYGGTKVTTQLDQHKVTSEPFYVGPRITDTDLLMKLEDNARHTTFSLMQGRTDRVFAAALSAAGAGSALNLTITGTVAVDVVQAAIEAVQLASFGAAPIRVLFGTSAFRKFCNHPSVQGRINGGATKTNNSTPTEQQVADILGYGVEIRQSRAIKNTAQIGQTATPAYTLGDVILIAAVSPNPSTTDPSALKLFVGYGDNSFAPKYRLVRGDDSDYEEATWGWAEKVVNSNSGAISRLNIT
ncbi:MAG: major capsid protein [Bryobacteraceae bacterium]